MRSIACEFGTLPKTCLYTCEATANLSNNLLQQHTYNEFDLAEVAQR